jgi:DNA-binding MarR family transcriptional regulator
MESTKILDLLNNLRKRCIANDDELMNSLNISLAEFNFFLTIDTDTILSSEWLAENLNLSLSRVSRIIDRMVINGLLIRTADPNDRRAIKLELSEKGLYIYKRVMINKIDCEKNIRKNLSHDESLELESNLKRIISLL